METESLKYTLEALIMVSDEPLTADKLLKLIDNETLNVAQVKEALDALVEDYSGRGIELKEVATGFRFQANVEYQPFYVKFMHEKPPRYSRALLETLAIIAYRQPATRAEVEAIRGVAVSTSIMKTLLEREWVRVVGHRDVPGKPSIYATTKYFLDYFNLKKLDELPPLQEVKDLASIMAKGDSSGIKLNDETGQMELDIENAEGEGEDNAERGAEEEVESEAEAASKTMFNFSRDEINAHDEKAQNFVKEIDEEVGKASEILKSIEDEKKRREEEAKALEEAAKAEAEGGVVAEGKEQGSGEESCTTKQDSTIVAQSMAEEAEAKTSAVSAVETEELESEISAESELETEALDAEISAESEQKSEELDSDISAESELETEVLDAEVSAESEQKSEELESDISAESELETEVLEAETSAESDLMRDELETETLSDPQIVAKELESALSTEANTLGSELTAESALEQSETVVTEEESVTSALDVSDIAREHQAIDDTDETDEVKALEEEV